MNLLQLRTKFREISGRFDLVDEDFSDSGADFYINEGRKYLDRLDETQKSWGSTFVKVAVGGWHATFPYCRAIKEVWISSSTARWRAEKMDVQKMMERYLTGIPSSRSSGTPIYYAPCITRLVPEDIAADDIEAFAGFVDVSAGLAHGFNTILLDVPTDKILAITINGLFYSGELVNDTDMNYWSEVHPMLLISSAMRQIEIVNRNTQGVNDWTGAINAEVQQLGFDLVEELIGECNQMEG